MKKNMYVAGILCTISLICAILIAGVYMLTEGTIKQYNEDKVTNTCKSIFSDYDSNSEELTGDKLAGHNSSITSIIYAKNSNGDDLGIIYQLTGKNDYGTIRLMVAIKDNKVHKVEFLENGQSFASTVQDHVNKNYPSNPSEVIYPLIKPEEVEKKDDLSNLDNVDVNCGATYGANTVKELVQIALDDAKGAN